MSRIRVVVTQDDIDAATPLKSRECPLALALNRGGFPDAAVWPSLNGAGTWNPSQFLEWFPLSARATAYANDFDNGKPVQPATFYLEGPARS